ncbi:MAG: cell division protein FtsQ/DivIB [Chromatiales bacterium]|nr:cell division protein FtsQ/DivIB [Chromatiales bacterium]
MIKAPSSVVKALRRRRQGGTRRVDRAFARKRLFKWAGAGLAGVALAGAVAVFSFGLVPLPLPLPERDFPIRTLKVEGAFEHVGRDEVTAVVAPLVAQGFFDTDVANIRVALLDLPWVRAAAVRRVWPDTLHVTLIEERAVARWEEGGLVNAEGRVFYPAADDVPKGLPLLKGPTRNAPQVVASYLALQQELAPLGLAIVDLSMDARRAWELTLTNGIRLTLGRQDAQHQVQRFVSLYPRVMAARAADIEQVDLRYSNGFAVRWRAPSASAQVTPKKTGDAV